MADPLTPGARTRLERLEGPQTQGAPPEAQEGPSRAMSDRRASRHPARHDRDDAPIEPVLFVRHGREQGGRVWIDQRTIQEALSSTTIPTDTPLEDLEVLRRVLGGHAKEGQILLVIRPRKGATP